MTRSDVLPLSASSTDDELKAGLRQTISGFEPATTGRVCDLCNAGIAPNTEVLVIAWFEADAGAWHLQRTYCDDHDPEAEGPGTEAVARCETGALIDGEWLPLLNPEIVAFNRG